MIGFLDEKIVGVGLNGFFGTITSCIGVYQNWKWEILLLSKWFKIGFFFNFNLRR